MAFDPVHLVHPKTGVVVEATTAVDLTNFRFNDGYVPVETATALTKAEGGEEKYPKLVEGLKQVETINKERAEAESKSDDAPAETETADTAGADEKATKAPASKPAGSAKSGAAKSGTDASGNQVGVN